MQPLKSILKKADPPSSTPPAPNPRHLEVALHHATIIDQQKKTEQQILDSIIDLLDYPTNSNADPARPSPADATAFCQHLIPFQPSDYDALIEERNVADRCGYALCPRPPKRAPSKAKLQFVETDKGVEIVEKSKLEVWCSEDCARRALYIKVQLNEEPAWSRRGGIGGKIELLAENKEEHHMVLPLRLKHDPKPASTTEKDVSEEEAAWADRELAMADLELERGEKPGVPTKANRDLLKSDIQERTDIKAPDTPSKPIGNGELSHLAIEGHVPKEDKKKNKEADESDEGEDWDLT